MMGHQPVSVTLIGNYRAVHRGSHIAQVLLGRPSHFAVTLCDPHWYTESVPLVRKLLYGVWAVRTIVGSRLVVFNAMQHASLPFRVLIRLARILRKTIVVDFYISFYDTMVIDRKVSAPGSVRARGYLKADREAITDVDLVLFLSRAEKDYYCELLGVDPSHVRSAIVPLVSPYQQRARLPWASGKTDIPCLVWWGHLGNPLHGVETIAAALASLAAGGTRFRMLFFPAGSADQLDDLKRLISQHGLGDRCAIEPGLSMGNGKLASRLVKEADIALGVFGGTRKARTVPVNKVVESMSLGIPCVTGLSQAFQEQVSEGTLSMVPHLDHRALVARLHSLMNDPGTLRTAGDRATKEWRNVYSPWAFERRLVETLEGLE
jgi:glycosyltransferase involved in cell wall biosynthesis